MRSVGERELVLQGAAQFLHPVIREQLRTLSEFDAVDPFGGEHANVLPQLAKINLEGFELAKDLLLH